LIVNMRPLDAAFFARDTLKVAPDLIGKLLVHERPSGDRLIGRIVETEAYTQDDPAFHGWGIVDRATGLVKPEGRGYDLFGHPGKAYVYFIWFRYWLLNVVTEPEGVGGAVLIRAVEPLEGLRLMEERREGIRRPFDLTNGPGKLTQAFDIDGRFHNLPLTEPPLYLAEPDEAPVAWPIGTSSRIGITRGVDFKWRFFIRGSRFVSPGKPSDIVMREKMERKRLRG
jgi:DNA-3-methyladenine glycosylase